jgi:hypothetical protein
VYSTESIKTEGEENETEGVEKEPGTVDHKTMTADIKEEQGEPAAKKAKIPTKGATAKAKKPITVPTRRSARLKMVQPVKYT